MIAEQETVVCPQLLTVRAREIDSELSAVHVLRALYGEDELSRFLASTALPRHPYSAYAKLLQEVESVIPQ